VPVTFKLFDDLMLTRDTSLGFDDVPFSLIQVFLPDGAVHRDSVRGLVAKFAFVTIRTHCPHEIGCNPPPRLITVQRRLGRLGRPIAPRA
jgi:hypothetical protein